VAEPFWKASARAPSQPTSAASGAPASPGVTSSEERGGIRPGAVVTRDTHRPVTQLGKRGNDVEFGSRARAKPEAAIEPIICRVGALRRDATAVGDFHLHPPEDGIEGDSWTLGRCRRGGLFDAGERRRRRPRNAGQFPDGSAHDAVRRRHALEVCGALVVGEVDVDEYQSDRADECSRKIDGAPVGRP
jgi:hypothetical protein